MTLGLAEDYPATEMRRGKEWAQSNSGEAVRNNFILPIKEDA
jgi:hypothetical protein